MAWVENESEAPPPSDTALTRTWKFGRRMDQQIETGEGPVASSLETTNLELLDDRTAKLAQTGEVGVWNLKPKKMMLEMEFEVDEERDTYLLYQVMK
jgi:hypothetical protein